MTRPPLKQTQAIGMFRSHSIWIKMLLTEPYGSTTWDMANTGCPTQMGRVIDWRRFGIAEYFIKRITREMIDGTKFKLDSGVRECGRTRYLNY